MSPDEMRQLYDYNAWANRRALEAASALTEEQFTRVLGSSFASVRDTLVHIYSGEWVWLERFQGRTPTAFPDAKPFNTWPGLRSGISTASSNIAPLNSVFIAICYGSPSGMW